MIGPPLSNRQPLFEFRRLPMRLAGLVIGAMVAPALMPGGSARAQTMVPEGSSLVSGNHARPTGLAFDRSGNLYVANRADNTISKIAPGGSVRTFASGLASPEGLVFDHGGNLYVANSGNHTVSKV